MDLDRLAKDAVVALAERLPNMAHSATDALVGLIRERLASSRAGSRALGSLQAEPSGEAERQLTTDVLADELHRDPGFAERVAAALGRQRPQAQASAVVLGARSSVRGDVAGGNIDKTKRYHIGSIRFGGGGLAVLIVAGVLGAGGGGTALYAALTPDISDQAPATRSVFMVSSDGMSDDLDASGNGRQDGDHVVDVTFGKAALIATGGARVARLPAGETAGRGACQNVVEAHAVASIGGLKAGDVVCVVTTAGAIAAVTLSNVNHLEAGDRYIYTLNFAYWAAAA